MPSTHGDHYQLNTTTLIRHAARTYPEQEIVYRTADGGWDRYTYADCYRRVRQLANLLRGLGVGPADVVGVIDWNSKRHFELYWAIPALGSVMLQMNLRLATEDLAFVTDHSHAKVVFVDETLIPVAEALATAGVGVQSWVVMTDRPMSELSTTLPGAVSFEELMVAATEDGDLPMIDETSAYSACYTTGTTGRPKGIYYSHRGIYLHAMAQAQSLSMTPNDTVMLITPMFHGNCWGLPQSGTFAATRFVLPGRYVADDTSVLVDAMIAEEVTIANGAPAIFEPMLRYIETLSEKPDFSRTRLLSGATEPPLSMMRGFHDLTGADIVHGYGATETTPFVTTNCGIKPSLRSLPENARWNHKRYQGLPVTGVDIRIVDGDGNDLPFDGHSAGEVIVRGPWIIESYYNLDDNDSRFFEGYWRSGDVGSIDEHGYLKLTDRIKDVIKSGGEWISSIDMENAIAAHPNVIEAAVIGVPHPKWQERPIALIVTKDGTDLPLSEIHALLEDKFAKWQLPDIVIRQDALERTSVGKMNKKLMRAQHSETYADIEL
ncbi:long-chain-fatty-acid--CoA ligase [Gordonia polyisoprenivorans]|uniref:long-chain-fatty-acid--CoA ligase n=1 Tax=Gordonia polyisoprenivorans TaxID=84595 RepID=UPI00054F30EF|nr:long-chain-fatty-acid--CoA ligase [Gordonia polyisoprenivorans]QUD85895.1 long-chain-fatty-acid--CoA ligase [Gordonia polyisoprenivorans]